MFRRLLMLAALATSLCTSGTEASAQGYGYATRITSTGYAYSNGFWWKGGIAYIRESVPCSSSSTGYCWQYSPVGTISPTTEGWRERLLAIAAYRDKVAGQMRMSANEHNEFLETLKSLGLEDNFRWDGYGYSPIYASGGATEIAGQLGYQPYAQQGQTAYGVQQFVSPYSEIDVNLALKRSGDLIENAQHYTATANQEFAARIEQITNAQARVAEIQAKAELLKAAQPQQLQEPLTPVFSFRAVTRDGQVQVEPITAGPAQLTASDTDALRTAIVQNCVSCHNTEKPSGRVDMTKFFTFTPEQQQHVLLSLTTSNPKKRMPRTANGEAGSLDPATLRLFFLAVQPGPQASKYDAHGHGINSGKGKDGKGPK